ncbi:hypothetical protein [Actinomycetospora sp. NBRC 106375]|uniref:hypothetical protein n=1 Tax=Actinomycetospora sp. NBRC 106375 TaxID=3032207 RepID=UPI00255737E0|nr:hypothetical protein [Actinomycetospora sp. NBRC 106375]
MERSPRPDARRDPSPALGVAVRRALPSLLAPVVLAGGVLASQGGSAAWAAGVLVLLAVLAGAALVVATGVRDAVRQRRRRTATTLPSTVASSPGMGS